MSIGLIIVVVLVIWWVVSSGRSNRERQLAARQADLETWEYGEADDIGSTRVALHFPTMRLVTDGTSYEPGIPNRPRLVHEVRRSASGRWEVRLTHESWRQQLQLAEAEAAKAAPGFFRDDWQNKAHELGAGPQWTPVRDTMGSAIEVAYQRYIHQRP